VLRDLARFYIGTADFARAAQVGQEILSLADSQDDAGMRVDGHLLAGLGLFGSGDLRGILEQLDLAIAAFESPGYRARRFRVGTDPRVSCLTTSAFVLWLLGHPDQAVARADRAVALGSTLDPYSHAYGLYHSGFLHLWRSEPELVRERARQLLRLVADRDFPVWRALGTCLAGAANTLLGESADGLAQIFDGMEQYRGTGAPPAFWPYLRFVRAAALAGAGRTAEALATVDEILKAGIDPTDAVQLQLLKGDLLLARGETPASAEALYRLGLEGARAAGAAMLELQAQTRLRRLSRGRGEAGDGAELREVYERFTEGFATRDLLEARALLDAGDGTGDASDPV
jgi:hypothetical protein